MKRCLSMHMHVVKSYLRKEMNDKDHIQALVYLRGKVGRAAT